MLQVFKTGEGISWGDHHNCLFQELENSSVHPGNLANSWIPALTVSLKS
jgi:hypothetical protein